MTEQTTTATETRNVRRGQGVKVHKPIVMANGRVLGTRCVVDTTPRSFLRFTWTDAPVDCKSCLNSR